jgi:hypothetical protein
MNQYLEGGRENTIYKYQDCVYRPSGEWSKHVHAFLIYLHEKGFNKVPYPYGIDQDGNERLSYVDGIIYNGLLPENVMSDQALKAVALIMKGYHDLGAEYIQKLGGDEKWMLPKREPVETMCHGDFAPYNIAMDNKKVHGIIDFDTLHPGPRIWDIAYALYRWIPLMSPSNPENFGTKEDKLRRLKLFELSYGTEYFIGYDMIVWISDRLEFLINYMKSEAKKGNPTFIKHIEEGHLDQYLVDLEYIKVLKI